MGTPKIQKTIWFTVEEMEILERHRSEKGHKNITETIRGFIKNGLDVPRSGS